MPMLRALYVTLLRLHPSFFRKQFGEEMLWIYDQTASARRAWVLLGDAVRSLATQWMFRSEFEEPNRLAASDRVPVFYTAGSDMPPPSALVNGLAGSVALFALAGFALAHSGGGARVFTYYAGDFHAGPPTYGEATPERHAKDDSPGLWSKVTSMFHSAPAAATIHAPSPPGGVTSDVAPAKPGDNGGMKSAASGAPVTNGMPAGVAGVERSTTSMGKTEVTPGTGLTTGEPRYPFAHSPLLAALDTDRDGIISTEEMKAAPVTLKTLDMNQDGNLDPEECGHHAPTVVQRTGQKAIDSKQAVLLEKRARRNFSRLDRVFAALDANHDGEISAAEIRNATSVLGTLDRNHDGRLTLEEISVDPVARETASIFRLDTDFDNRISRAERSTRDGRPLANLLRAADRNRDGYVTWEELSAEIRSRADLNHDGVVTWEEMAQARKSGALAKPATPIPQPNDLR